MNHAMCQPPNCRACGTSLDRDEIFTDCPLCGAPVEDSARPLEPATAGTDR